MKAITSEIEDGIVRICEGNPGALTVLCRMVKAAPNAITAELMLHALELAGITGSRLWQEYKDVHQFDIDAMVKAAVERLGRAGRGT